MGLFTLSVTLTGPTGQREDLAVLVDTGATFVVIPEAVAERLKIQPSRTVPLQMAGGRNDEWPLAEVRITVNDLETTTPCLISPGGPALLGAVALESLLLGVDPVAKRLVPVRAFVGSAVSVEGTERR
jgi:clan AA aspartic protease